MTVRTNSVRPETEDSLAQDATTTADAPTTRGMTTALPPPAPSHNPTTQPQPRDPALSRPASGFYGLNLSAIFAAAVGNSGSNDGGEGGRPGDGGGDPAAGPYNVLDVLHVLTDFRQNHERLKLYRVSLSVIRFLSVLNFVYTVLGVTFLLLALCTEWTPEFDDRQRAQFFKIGEALSLTFKRAATLFGS